MESLSYTNPFLKGRQERLHLMVTIVEKMEGMPEEQLIGYLAFRMGLTSDRVREYIRQALDAALLDRDPDGYLTYTGPHVESNPARVEDARLKHIVGIAETRKGVRELKRKPVKEKEEDKKEEKKEDKKG